MDRRIVVTGLGPVTSIGEGRDAFWEALLAGRSGVRNVEDLVNLEGIDVKIAAPLADFDATEYIDPKKARRVDRSAQLAMAAAKLAMEDADIPAEAIDVDRACVIAGTGIGGMLTFEENMNILAEKGPRKVSPFFVPRMMPNAMSGEISIQFGFRGPNFGVVSACASSAHAIGLAARLIQDGAADIAIAGGAESVLLRITFAGFARMGALSKRNDEPERASRPFDKDRDGFVMGEGGGFLVLETLDAARKRGARIYGEVAGFGMSADASHITAPCEDGRGQAQAMRLAIQQAGIEPQEIDYINAHGTSTGLNDPAETAAIKSALGSAAQDVKISSTKSQIGHLLGAAGGVESIATLLAMEHGQIPATLNHETPDPACDLDYTPETTSMPIRVALSNSFGFGGQNATVLFKKDVQD